MDVKNSVYINLETGDVQPHPPSFSRLLSFSPVFLVPPTRINMSTGPSSRVLRSAKRLAPCSHSCIQSEGTAGHPPRQGLHTAVDLSNTGIRSADTRPVGIAPARAHQSAPLDSVSPVKSEDATYQNLFMEGAVGPLKAESVISPVKAEDVRAVIPVEASVVSADSKPAHLIPTRDHQSALLDSPSLLNFARHLEGARREPSRPRSPLCSRPDVEPNVLHRGNLRSARYKPYDLHPRPDVPPLERKQVVSAMPDIRKRTPSTRNVFKSLPDSPLPFPSTSMAPLMATAHPHHDASSQPRGSAVSTVPRIHPDASRERRGQVIPATMAPTPLPAIPLQLPSVSVSVQAQSSNVNVNVALTLSPGRNL